MYNSLVFAYQANAFKRGCFIVSLMGLSLLSMYNQYSKLFPIYVQVFFFRSSQKRLAKITTITLKERFSPISHRRTPLAKEGAIYLGRPATAVIRSFCCHQIATKVHLLWRISPEDPFERCTAEWR